MSDPLAIIGGAGAGLGQTLVRAFAQNGYTSIGLNRSIPDAAAGSTHAVDLSDPDQTAQTVSDLIETLGAPKLVVHNAAKLLIAGFEDTTNADFEATWRAMVLQLLIWPEACCLLWWKTAAAPSSSLAQQRVCAVARILRPLLRLRRGCGH
ncbi:SDR family NAD(P)-dependent oxidoreductase [Rhodobacteraceae bacterium KMM 6894]|nr:SDR family NAD(P)-dependent oxidoreductase [Rhodobacteraceae bacterium KMM 6894]